MSLELAQNKKRQTGKLIRDSANELKNTYRTLVRFVATDYAIDLSKQFGEVSSELDATRILNRTPVRESAIKKAVTYSMLRTRARARDSIESLKKKKIPKLAEVRTLATRAERIKGYEKKITELLFELDRLNGIIGPSFSQKAIADLIGPIMSALDETWVAASDLIAAEYGMSSATVSVVKGRAENLAYTIGRDIEKSIGLQYVASMNSTESVEELFSDLQDSVDAVSSGAIVEKGPDVTASQEFNEERESYIDEWSKETGDMVVSYTYVAVDDEKTTDLCLGLNGHTWDANDPDRNRWVPPLHWNCRSYVEPNLASMRDNPEVSDSPVPSKLIDLVQFSETSVFRKLAAPVKFGEYQGKKVKLDTPFVLSGFGRLGVYVEDESGETLCIQFSLKNNERSVGPMRDKDLKVIRDLVSPKVDEKLDSGFWTDCVTFEKTEE